MLSISGKELSIPQAVNFLIDNKKYIDQSQLHRLANSLGVAEILPRKEEEVGSMDLLLEIQEQMEMVRVLRRNILAKGETAATKDLKDLISTSTTLFSMLTKLNSDVLNQDRLRKIESATVRAIEKLPLEVQKEFFNDLEGNLSD